MVEFPDPVVYNIVLPYSQVAFVVLFFLGAYTLFRLVLVIWSRLIP